MNLQSETVNAGACSYAQGYWCPMNADGSREFTKDNKRTITIGYNSKQAGANQEIQVGDAPPEGLYTGRCTLPGESVSETFELSFMPNSAAGFNVSGVNTNRNRAATDITGVLVPREGLHDWHGGTLTIWVPPGPVTGSESEGESAADAVSDTNKQSTSRPTAAAALATTHQHHQQQLQRQHVRGCQLPARARSAH